MSQTCASCLTFSMDKITKSQPELKPHWCWKRKAID